MAPTKTTSADRADLLPPATELPVPGVSGGVDDGGEIGEKEQSGESGECSRVRLRSRGAAAGQVRL